MADPTNPVGVLVNNPIMATSQAGSEETVNPSAINPSGPDAAPATNASSVPAPVNSAVQTFQSAFDAATESLEPSLLELPPKDTARHAKVGAKQRRVIDMVSVMLRANPTLSGSYTADDMDAATADTDVCTQLSANLGTLATKVNNTGRLRLESASQMSSEVLSLARKRAPQSTALASAVAAIDAVTAKGPAADTAEQVAVVKQQRATKATARATKATEEASTATARANALQHGTGDATITQPAPAAPAATASSTTALAATPGTPGSTTIR